MSIIKKILLISCLLFGLSNVYTQSVIDSSIVMQEEVIYFDSDEWILDAADLKTISDFVLVSKIYKNCKFSVNAHTDKIGSEEYNIALSGKREKTIIDQLLINDIPDSLIVSSHHGESRLAALGHGEESNKLNRRATIQLLMDKKLIYLTGIVFDEEDKTGIGAGIELHTKDLHFKTTSEKDGDFKIMSPLGERVTLEVLAKGYFIEANTIDISEKHIGLQLKIPLPKLELGKRYLFKNMFFHGNRSVMISNSQFAAYHLKRFMSLNDEVCVEIAGHINLPNKENVERESGNFELSVARSLMIKDELLAEGVKEERMVARGYGNWEMKFPETNNPKEMQQNRRVEIGVVDCESAVHMKDDTLEDKLRYQSTNYNRKFSERLMKYDLDNFSKVTTANLILHINNMRNNNLIPEEFTYQEIIKAYPDFPVKE